MKRITPNGFLIAAVSLSIVGFFSPFIQSSSDFSAVMYFLASSIVSFELIDLAARIWMSRLASNAQRGVALSPSRVKRTTLHPFAIVMSVHDFLSRADDTLTLLQPFKTRTWIIDDCSSDETALYLRSQGWRCLGSERNLRKPAALRALLDRLPRDIRTVVVLDPDSAPLDSGRFEVCDLQHAIQSFQARGVAACCPRIRIRENGALTSFQLLECELAFSLGRKGMSPDCITSGVSIYDRIALQEALEEHSLSVYAEDFENSAILLSRGLPIDFDDELVVETDGKRDPAKWFSQRVGWSFGLIRVYASRWREIASIARRNPWSFYNLVVYLGLMALVLVPLKIVGIVVLAISFANGVDSLFGFGLIPDNKFTDPIYFSATYATYTFLCACLVVYLKPPARLSTLIPAVCFYVFYAAANTAAACVGYLNWLSLLVYGKRIYCDHYTEEGEIRVRLQDSEQMP